MDAPKWLNGYSGQSVDELLSLEGKYRDFTIALGTDVFFTDGLSRAQRTAYGYAGCRVAWHSGESVDRADIRIVSRYPRDLLTFQPCLEYCQRPCRNPNPLCPTARRTDRSNQLRYL